jgi:nucleoside-diphosphate-sugar epimerase
MDLQQVFQGKNILISGGLGFIGSNLARRLVNLGAHVLIVDSLDPNCGGNLFNLDGAREQAQVILADLREKGVIDGLISGQDYFFNLAGQVSHIDSMQDPEADLQINAGVQLSVVEACRKYNPDVKIVFAGTRQVYGRPQYLPVDENHPVIPIDFNGVTKRAGEQYHMVGHRVYGLHVVSLRMTNTYGPRMRVRDGRQMFMGWWIHQLLEGKVIPIFGDGGQIRDLNYIEDVLQALLLAAACPASDGKIYNLGSDEPICLLDLAHLMISIYGRGSYEMVPFPEDRKQIDIGDYYGDYTKIKTELGWQPLTRLRHGIACTLAFYVENKAYYQ